uniref:Uncharacterized protein n=1 Tax=Anguilla anguilla TaxID=7936 RepID=A0A0E9V2J8_ANGAN
MAYVSSFSWPGIENEPLLKENESPNRYLRGVIYWVHQQGACERQ